LVPDTFCCPETDATLAAHETVDDRLQNTASWRWRIRSGRCHGSHGAQELANKAQAFIDSLPFGIGDVLNGIGDAGVAVL
jgi:hypothetical protein